MVIEGNRLNMFWSITAMHLHIKALVQQTLTLTSTRLS